MKKFKDNLKKKVRRKKRQIEGQDFEDDSDSETSPSLKKQNLQKKEKKSPLKFTVVKLLPK